MDLRSDSATNEFRHHRAGPGQERAGIYLAALVALVVPSLIVVALFLPEGAPFAQRNGERAASDNGLDAGSIAANDETPSDEGVATEVAGAGQSNVEPSTEIGDAAVITAPAPTTILVAGPESTDGQTNREAQATTTTIALTTTTAAATTTTTTTAPTTTTTTAPAVEPSAFASRVEIGRIGETTLQFRFSVATPTAFTTTIRSGSDVVLRQTGLAMANTLVNETVTELEPGTDHTVQVTLEGPPNASSPPVEFRTGGGDAERIASEIGFIDLRVVESGSTQFEVNYESNICANGSFVIREQGGPVVGNNAGQPTGCTTRHLGIPGFWTPALKPSTTYVITMQVEANGAGLGDGNIASQSLIVTTNA